MSNVALKDYYIAYFDILGYKAFFADKGNKKSLYRDYNLTTGALGRNRTHNPLVRSQVLYPVELLALMEVPVGLEPTIIELQSIALPAWLRNHKHSYYTI